MYDGLYRLFDRLDVQSSPADHPTEPRRGRSARPRRRVDALDAPKYAPSQSRQLRPLDELLEPMRRAAGAGSRRALSLPRRALCAPRNIDVRVLWANRRMVGEGAVPAAWDGLVDSLDVRLPGTRVRLFGVLRDRHRAGRAPVIPLDDALRPTLATDAGRYAVDTLVGLAQRAPSDLSEWHYDQVDAALADGRVALAAAWPGATRALRGSTSGQALAPFPYLSGQLGLRSYAGCHAWAIPTTCADVDGAVQLIRRLCSADAHGLEAASGAVCAHTGVFASVRGADEIDARRLEITRRTIAGGMITYPPLVRFPQIEDAGWAALRRALRREVERDAALAEMQIAAARVLAEATP